jgi:hypothetical protein
MSYMIRISFLLAREDNPRLYDELIQFPKGQRRVNRLRTLAYDGLLAQRVPMGHLVAPAGADDGAGASSTPSVDRAKASMELFSEPLSE